MPEVYIDSLLETYPASSECYCHLLPGHPHSSLNAMCDVCRAEFEAIIDMEPWTEPEPIAWEPELTEWRKMPIAA